MVIKYCLSVLQPLLYNLFDFFCKISNRIENIKNIKNNMILLIFSIFWYFLKYHIFQPWLRDRNHRKLQQQYFILYSKKLCNYNSGEVGGNCVAEIRGGRYQRNVKIRTLWGDFLTIFPTGVVVGFWVPPPGGAVFFWNSPYYVRNTSQLISVIIPTLVLHHSFSLSLQAQNLPFQQILPTVDFFLPTGLPHDNGTGPDLLCSSFYF